jgi:hypothetical protein
MLTQEASEIFSHFIPVPSFIPMTSLLIQVSRKESRRNKAQRTQRKSLRVLCEKPLRTLRDILSFHIKHFLQVLILRRTMRVTGICNPISAKQFSYSILPGLFLTAKNKCRLVGKKDLPFPAGCLLLW